MYKFREQSTPQMKGRFLGVVSTAWSGAGAFLNEFYGKQPVENKERGSVADTFKAVFPKP